MWGVTLKKYVNTNPTVIKATTAIPLKQLNRLKATLNRPGFDGVGFGIWCWFVIGVSATGFWWPVWVGIFSTDVGVSCTSENIASASA
jgi:hypothetical protein